MADKMVVMKDNFEVVMRVFQLVYSAAQKLGPLKVVNWEHNLVD